jgi:plasmid stabilization system protein ParE
MRPFEVRHRPAALLHLEDIRHRIAETTGPIAAQRFLDQVIAHLDGFANAPNEARDGIIFSRAFVRLVGNER